MARPAEEPVVVESALAATVGDRHDVVRFPSGPPGTPGSPGRAIGCRRLRSGPLAVRLHHVEAAQPADPFVPLLDLAAHVPGAASNLPFLDARIAAEGSPRRDHRTPAPSADRLTVWVALWFPPLIGRHDPYAPGAHGRCIGRIGFRLWASGFGLQALGFRLWASGFGFQGAEIYRKLRAEPKAERPRPPPQEPKAQEPKAQSPKPIEPPSCAARAPPAARLRRASRSTR